MTAKSKPITIIILTIYTSHNQYYKHDTKSLVSAMDSAMEYLYVLPGVIVVRVS